jgi:hypothetical protein
VKRPSASVPERERPDLQAVATSVGELWAEELTRSLRADKREIAGGWPGTMGEARMRIRRELQIAIEPLVADDLARVAITAARRAWKVALEADAIRARS